MDIKMDIKTCFFTIYFSIAIVIGVVIITDYTDCYKLKGNIRHAQSVDAGFSMILGGLIWPITLPGMLALYDDREDHYCL